jgi:hypothetical protein
LPLQAIIMPSSMTSVPTSNSLRFALLKPSTYNETPAQGLSNNFSQQVSGP